MLAAAGCYERRDACIRKLVPEFGPGWGCKVVIANPLKRRGLQPHHAGGAVAGRGKQQKLRMPLDVYLGIVAATNMKQRTRKQIEYYHADRLNYAVIGTPNRLEYDQGFFVKNGDGAADVKPIAHLYKTQVYPARRASRRARGDPPAAADHRHLVAGADAGGVLLLAALSRDGPLPLRPEQRRACRGSGAGGGPDRGAGRAGVARHRIQAPHHGLPARAADAGRGVAFAGEALRRTDHAPRRPGPAHRARPFRR